MSSPYCYYFAVAFIRASAAAAILDLKSSLPAGGAAVLPLPPTFCPGPDALDTLLSNLKSQQQTSQIAQRDDDVPNLRTCILCKASHVKVCLARLSNFFLATAQPSWLKQLGAAY